MKRKMLKKMLNTVGQALWFELGFGKQPDFLIRDKYYAIQDVYQGRCLDFGAGTCAFTYFLIKQGHNVIPIDIVNKSRYQVRPVLFDGIRLPFHDNTFDTCLCMFVLHHLSRQEDVIQELRRVTKQYLIVGEDLLENPYDRILTTIHTQSSLWSKSRHSFKSNEAWQQFFNRHRFQIIQKIIIPRYHIPYYPIRRAVYVLKKGE